MKRLLKTEFLIIIFLWINIIYSLINISNPKIFQIAGIIGLTIVTVLYFLKKDFNVILLLFLLGLGIINLVTFNESLQISFMGIFNIVNIVIFSILVYKKWDIVSYLYEKWFGTTKEEYIEQRKSKVEFFKKRFENLSDEELKNKLNNNLSDEAKKAIIELLIQRK